MKKLCITVAAFALTIGAQAGNGGDKPTKSNDKFCASREKDGELIVYHNDEIITTDAVLENGTIVKPDGIILYKDGTRTYLSENQCITFDGWMVDKETSKQELKSDKQEHRHKAKTTKLSKDVY